MASHFIFEGLNELKAELRKLPTELTGEAANIIKEEGNAAVATLMGRYPVRSTGLHPGSHRKSRWFPPGKLRDSNYVVFEKSPLSALATVKNTDPIAWLYDNGSQARHWSGGKFVGKMPPSHFFVRTMILRRRVMYERLQDLLVRHGLSVSGTP